jgi:hypothetical protein
MPALTKNLPLPLMSSQWSTQISDLLQNPLVQGSVLPNVALINGTTTVNHKLGKKLTGWILVGINGTAEIYDLQTTNPRPELTLILVSNAAVNVNLYVF